MLRSRFAVASVDSRLDSADIMTADAFASAVISGDYNADGMVDATDDHWLYEEVRGRINFTEIGASPLLRKPSNNHHGGNLVAGFDTRTAPGDAMRARYDLFLNWILNGAPE